MVEEYFNPRAPGSYAGISTFLRHTKGSVKELGPLLAVHPAYTRHKPARRRFPRNKTMVGGIDHLWQADLADVAEYRTYNKGTRFLLVVIDTFSKKAFVEPLRDKRPVTVRDGFDRILKRTSRRPLKLFTDGGSEFVGKPFSDYLKDKNIDFYRAYTAETKASVAERYMRTIKNKIYRYLTHHRTHRYLDVLQDLVHSYNETFHRSIGRTPNSVDETNESEVWHRLYDRKSPPADLNDPLKIGDYVRLVVARSTFQKAYKPMWTEEVFMVTKVHRRDWPPAYSVVDLDGEHILGTFSPYELQKIPFNKDTFIPDSVVKTRQRRGKKEYLVHYRDRPSTQDAWQKAKPRLT